MKKTKVKILTGLAGALVAVSMIYAIWVGIAAAKLHRVCAALEKAGRPMEVDQIIPPKVPETENAALLYNSAILLLKAQPATEENLLAYLSDLSGKFTKESLEAGQRVELERLLQDDVVTQALLAIERGTGRATCRFDLDYNAGINISVPHLQDTLHLTRILAAKAQLQAEAGNSDSAWDLVLAQLKIADAARAEPIIISQFVRATWIRFACQTVQRLCAIAPPNQQQYARIEALLNTFDDVLPLVRAADGERLFGQTIFTLPKRQQHETMRILADEDHAPWIIRTLIIRRMAFKPLLLADHATYLHFMHRYTDLFERPYSRGTAEIPVEDATKHHLLTRMLLPAANRAKARYTAMIAEARITRVGMALLRHQATHGVFPETLDGLQLAGLNDPFSAGPLRYRPEADGFVLYSVAADQKDNGGIAQESEQETDYDIVWHFPGPAVR